MCECEHVGEKEGEGRGRGGRGGAVECILITLLCRHAMDGMALQHESHVKKVCILTVPITPLVAGRCDVI